MNFGSDAEAGNAQRHLLRRWREGQSLLPWHSSSQMVAVLRRPTRDRDTVTTAVAEPPKPSTAEAATDDSFATAKHYICTILGVVMAVHFYSAYVQNTALSGKDGLVPCAAYVKDRIKTGSFWTWPCVWLSLIHI